MNVVDLTLQNPWGADAPKQAFEQVAELCQQQTGLSVKVGSDGRRFMDQADPVPLDGILALHGDLSTEDVITIYLKLIDHAANVRVPAKDFISHLAGLDQKLSIADRLPSENDISGLWIKMGIKAVPMSVARTGVFLDKLKQLEGLAKLLQSELPAKGSRRSLLKMYKKFKETLQPIFPVDPEMVAGCSDLVDWAEETLAFLTGAGLVAVAAPTDTVMSCALAVLSYKSEKANLTLGKVHVPSLSAKGLLELSAEAPGALVVPAVQISLAANPYELSSEMQSTMSLLQRQLTPILFTGTLEELQNTFAGGQGARHDPLIPAVRHIPDIPNAVMVRHRIVTLGNQKGGFSPKALATLHQQTMIDLQSLRAGDRQRMLPLVVRRVVNDWERGLLGAEKERRGFIATAREATETLGGIVIQPRAHRAAHIQANYTNVLTDERLLDYLKSHLLAQDRALKRLTDRLAMEVLTRPVSQPIRLWAQGTPSTGKSESCVLLARRLNIPYVNIDAGSFPNYHTAYSQLLGAARSYVGSHMAGRLEQVAGHHSGCLVELSDIDHAPHEVRVFIGDLFLQLLETGEGQSAMGAMFNCTNLIIVFTMNLPNGMDESVRKHLGFGKGPSYDVVQSSVIAEVKGMLSGALLSRLGSPILYEPLEGAALARILEMAVEKALQSALDRLGLQPSAIKLADGLGQQLIGAMQANVKTFGARAILEHGRHLAAQAALTNITASDAGLNADIMISATADGGLKIKTKMHASTAIKGELS